MVYFSLTLSILPLGEVSFKEGSFAVTYMVDCGFDTIQGIQLTFSLSDRIGRKWVLAWLTVLLAVVSQASKTMAEAEDRVLT